MKTMAQSKAEKRSPHTAKLSPTRRVHPHGLRTANEALAVGGVVGALEEVEEGAPHRAHPERPAHVVQDPVRARLPRRLRRPHGNSG